MRRVLVLRPEPGATATVERAHEFGLEAIAVPLFRIDPVTWIAPGAAQFDALLLTSANAVRHGGEELRKLRGLPVYAVGEATARAARDAGFTIAAVGDAGVDQLFSTISPDLKLLHPCGEDRSTPSTPSPEITPITIYRAVEAPEPDLGDCSESVVLIHSPRAGRRFGELVRNRGGVTIAAISPAAAKAVGTGWKAVETSDQPNDEALLALAARLCNKPATQ